MNDDNARIKLGQGLLNMLAESDADTQGEFLNGFWRHLKVCCKGRHDTQACYIADYLDENGRECVETLAQYAKLSLETRAKHEFDMQELYRQRHELEKEIEAVRKAREALEQHP